MGAPLRLIRCWSNRRPASTYQADDKQHQKDQEANFRDHRCHTRHGNESQQTCNQRDDQKKNGVIEHFDRLLRTWQHAGYQTGGSPCLPSVYTLWALGGGNPECVIPRFRLSAISRVLKSRPSGGAVDRFATKGEALYLARLIGRGLTRVSSRMRSRTFRTLPAVSELPSVSATIRT
jgi:hypothetical protein